MGTGCRALVAQTIASGSDDQVSAVMSKSVLRLAYSDLGARGRVRMVSENSWPPTKPWPFSCATPRDYPLWVP